MFEQTSVCYMTKEVWKAEQPDIICAVYYKSEKNNWTSNEFDLHHTQQPVMSSVCFCFKGHTWLETSENLTSVEELWTKSPKVGRTHSENVVWRK